MNKKLIFGLVFILLVATVSAISIDDVLSSYNYDYTASSFDVNSYDISGLDTGGSAKFDILTVNTSITTASSDFVLIGELHTDKLKQAVKYERSLSGTNQVKFNFTAKGLTESDYNFTIKIYENNLLKLKREKNFSFSINPSDYESKEIEATFMSDAGQDTASDSRFDQLEIDLSLNSSITDNVDIYAYLYDENGRVTFTKQNQAITNTVQTVSVIFDSSIIREKRLNGTLNLRKVTIDTGDILYDYDLNQTLSTYDKNDFDPKKTMFTENFVESTVNESGKITKLLIDAEVSVNESGVYTIKSAFYDPYATYIIDFEKNFTLTQGLDNAQLELNYSNIFSSKLSGPYYLGYLKILKDNQVIDYVATPFFSHSYLYSDWKKPPLPELSVSSANAIEPEKNISKLNVTILNSGAPAFNVKVTVYDNSSVSVGEQIITSLTSSETLLFERINFVNSSTFTIKVDVSDEIEENNEDNNEYTLNVVYDIEPTSSLTASTNSGIAPLSVTFTGTGTGGNEPLTYSWDFENDGTIDSTQQNPLHSFGAGTHIVNFTVTDVDGDKHSSTITITATLPNGPTAEGYSDIYSGMAPLEIHLTSQASSGTPPYTNSWDINNDGSYEYSTDSPTHVFNDAGSYSVTHKVCDSNSLCNTKTFTITASVKTSPVANPSSDISVGSSPLSVSFTGQYTGGKPTHTFSWDIGNDGSVESTSQNYAHVFTESTNVKFTVCDLTMDCDSKIIPITIGGFTCSINSTPESGAEPFFVDLASITSNDAVAPLTYEWDLDNDGDTDWTLDSVNLPYFAGSNVIQLYITDSNGFTCHATKTIVVTTSVPVAKIQQLVTPNFASKVGQEPFNIKLNGTATDGDGVLSYKWDINNDGTYDYTTQEIEHNYTAGEYHTKLTVCDADGDCSDDFIDFDVLTAAKYEELRHIGMNIKFDKSGALDSYTPSETIAMTLETLGLIEQNIDVKVRYFSPYGSIVFEDPNQYPITTLFQNMNVNSIHTFDIKISDYPDVFNRTGFYQFMTCDTGKICQSMYMNSALKQIIVS